MHQIGFWGKNGGTLESKEKDYGSKISNLSVMISCKVTDKAGETLKNIT